MTWECESHFMEPSRKTRCHFSVVTTSKARKKTAAMKERIQLYSRLYVGSKFRQANLDDFFRRENHKYPNTVRSVSQQQNLIS